MKKIYLIFALLIAAAAGYATAQLQIGLCRAGVEALRVHNPAVTLRAIESAGL